MSRPRTPTKVLDLRGSFVKHPERRKAREHEPAVDALLGKPPECLNEAQRARWQDIASWCHWLRQPDRALVEQTARLWVKMRDNSASAADMKLLQTNLTRLGMTPADRSKIQVPDVKPKDRKTRFFA